MNILAVLGGGAALLWLVNKKSDTVDSLTAQAIPIAQEHVANGVPPDQAAALAATSVLAQAGKLPPPPPPITYSQTPVITTPTGPILSLNDPRLSQAQANVGAMFGSPVSAAGMPVDVRNALVGKGWIWTGSYFNPGSLYPPGTDQSKIIVAA